VKSWSNYLPLDVVGIARGLDLLTAVVTAERCEAMGQAVHALKPGLRPTDFEPRHRHGCEAAAIVMSSVTPGCSARYMAALRQTAWTMARQRLLLCPVLQPQEKPVSPETLRKQQWRSNLLYGDWKRAESRPHLLTSLICCRHWIPVRVLAVWDPGQGLRASP
jgi:hypothetical protein